MRVSINLIVVFKNNILISTLQHFYKMTSGITLDKNNYKNQYIAKQSLNGFKILMNIYILSKYLIDLV